MAKPKRQETVAVEKTTVDEKVIRKKRRAPKELEPSNYDAATIATGACSLVLALLSARHGMEDYGFKEHIFHFTISAVLALLMGLSPGVRDLGRFLNGQGTKVQDKRFIAGVVLILGALGFQFGPLGPHGMLTVTALTFTVMTFS